MLWALAIAVCFIASPTFQELKDLRHEYSRAQFETHWQ